MATLVRSYVSAPGIRPAIKESAVVRIARGLQELTQNNELRLSSQ